MSKKNALAFTVGLGSGYLSANRQMKSDQRQAKDDAWREEQRAAERDRIQREKQDRVALADAVAPRTAIEGTAVDTPAGLTLYKDPAQAQAAAGEAQIEAEMRGVPSLAAARPAYGVTGTSVGNQITTEKPDVAALNSTDARMGRVVDTTMATDPAKALTLQNAALSGKRSQMEIDEIIRGRRKAIETEGLIKTAQASRTGDPNAVIQAFNANGEWKVDGELKVTPEKRKAPWGGEVETFTYTGTIKGPDGKIKPVRLNSLEAMVQLVPFQDMFKMEAELGKGAVQHNNNISLENVRHGNDMKEIGARGGQDRATLDHRKATGTDKTPIGREERLRYTTLFQDAGRRMAEAQKALSTLQKNPVYSIAKPGSAQHTELQGLRDTIRQYGDERSMYQSLLAESQTAPAGRGGSGAQKDGKPKAVSSKAERDALPKGARYIGPDGQTYIKQ
jgi:hypothetical protein